MGNLLLISLFLLSILSFSCTPPRYASEAEYAPKYLNRVDEGYQLTKTWYHYSVETNGKEFIYKQYFPSSMVMTHKLRYSDARLKRKNGLAEEWYDNGHRMSRGAYRNDKKEGVWEYYSYRTDRLLEYGDYKNGLRDSIWTKVDSSSTIRSTVTYEMGKKEGAFRYFDKNGDLFQEGIYKDDKVTFDTTYFKGDYFYPTPVDSMPKLLDCPGLVPQQRMACSNGNMVGAMRLKYPVFERRMGIEGRALIRFIIDEDGRISHFEVTRGISDGIKNELIASFPKNSTWATAMKDGEPVKVVYTLPVSFKLEN